MEHDMKHSLVVDDSRVIRKIACRILEDLSFDTVEADSGPAGLAHCRSSMPDVILLGSDPPLMTAVEFLRELRKEPRGDLPVVVYCTTENDSQHITDALGAGASEFMMKPFNTHEIQCKLAEFGLV